MECWSDGWPSGTFSHLHTALLELSQSDQWVLGHVSYPNPFHQISLWDPRLFPESWMFWTSSILKWWHPLSSLPWSVQQELVCSLLQNSCSWALEGVLLPLWLVFSLIASCETLYRRVCFFPNHVQSVWFTTRETNLSVNASRRHPKLNPPPPKKTQKSLKTFQLHCKSCFLTYGEWKQL